ncbi:serine hydroxymethyltransferase [Micromonospora zamorensis]|uniref:serine hydroxymethyltransferase n=1 Tax=Micromonospora zamorensis TaxID=709883 RepID=UPI0033ECE841
MTAVNALAVGVGGRSVSEAFHQAAIGSLNRDDPVLAALLDREFGAQTGTLAAVAHASLAHPSVLAAAGSVLSNVTAEGYPGRRYHPGAEQFDEVERLAVERAKEAFGARHANVQPLSCSSANLVVLFSLLAPGGTLLSLNLDAGGHLTHGSAASITGRAFQSVHYGVDDAGLIDYGQVAELAREHRPGLIIAGASAYPRRIDYARFRAVADEVGAYLLADISHIAGLVAAGVVPSPIDIAHVTTASTYKQLGGPRGGLILLGREHARPGPDGRTPLSALLDRGVFPRVQGTPDPASIAAKARALHLVAGPEFRDTARRIAADARALAAALTRRGYRVLTGGTDTHMVIVDMAARGLTGAVAEQSLRDCGILANRNRIAGDTKPPLVGSGLRFGTNILAQRGMGPADMERLAELVDRVWQAVDARSDTAFHLDPAIRRSVRAEVDELCRRFPVPAYVLEGTW